MLSVIIILLIAAISFAFIRFAGIGGICYVAIALLIAIVLQYGYYPFLDEKGKAELLMWQIVSFPILFAISLSATGVICVAVWLGRRLWGQ